MIDKGVFQSTNLVFKDEESVQQLAEKHDRILLIYDSNVYDVTEFADRHPGGSGILEDFNGQDISDEFHDARIHKHSRSALNQMQQFLVGKVDEIQFEVRNIKNEAHTQYLIDYGEFQIDQSKPLLAQIEKLSDHHYQILLDTNLSLVFSPRFKDEDIKRTVQFEDNLVLEQKLWCRRSTLAEFQIFSALIGLLIFIYFYMHHYNLYIGCIVGFLSIFLDVRVFLRCITFSKRSSQFRFYQRCFPVKNFVTKPYFYAELALLLFFPFPFLQIYAIIQTGILGIRNKFIVRQTEKQFLK